MSYERQAETLIEALHAKIEEDGGQKPEHVANVMAQAQVYAILALADAIAGLGQDIKDAARDISTEVGGIGVTLSRS